VLTGVASEAPSSFSTVFSIIVEENCDSLEYSNLLARKQRH
jgi:hypothetical protein